MLKLVTFNTMNKGFTIFCLLIFSSLSVFTQTLSKDILIEIEGENRMTTFFQINGIRDTINIENIQITSAKITQDEIYPIPKQNLKSGFTYTTEFGYSSGNTMLYVHFSPFFYDSDGDMAKITKIDLEISSEQIEKKASQGTYKGINSSVLATGSWFKFAVLQEGIYKIDYETLKKSGLPVGNITSVKDLKIYSNGGEMLPFANNIGINEDIGQLALKYHDNGDGIFNVGDYLLFYAQGTINWKYDAVNDKFSHSTNIYSDTSFYFLTYNNDSPKEIGSIASLNSFNQSYNNFLDHQLHENDESNLLRSGILWLGDHYGETGSYLFQNIFKNIDINAEAKLHARLYAKNQSPGGSTFNLKVNNGPITNVYINSVSGNNADDVVKNSLSSYLFYPTNDTVFTEITYNSPNNSCEAWIDYYELNVYRKLKYENEMLFFRNPKSVSTGQKSQFKIANADGALSLWAVNNFENPQEINYNLISDTCEFVVATDTLVEFVLFNESACQSPIYIGTVKNQNLHSLLSKNMLIICPLAFLTQAQRLANFHETQDGISVQVVSIEEVYNEFCKGSKDVSGIRNFVKMLYNRGTNDADSLKYLLLLGDGTFDYKNHSAGNLNLIPTFQSSNSTKETASYTSDDFFALLDNNEGGWTVSSTELPDIAVGRIPAKNIEEAKIVIDKIFSYSNYFDGQNIEMLNDKAKLYGNWKNEILFIGDDEDYNIHQKQANQLATKVESTYPQINVDKIYLDSYQQENGVSQNYYPEAQKDLVDKINKGLFLINYTGHGGEDGLSGEKIITSQEIRKLENGIKLPLVFTATCDFSRFDMVNSVSAGEEFLLNPKGGAIALYSTTRVVYSSPNFNLNNNFYNIVFDFHQGNKTTIGDIFKDTKVTNNGGLNDRNFTLLGDPALRLTIPHKGYKTNILSVKNLIENQPTDTLKSLMRVKIEGEITDTAGNKQSNFNGYIYTKLFDKLIPYTTLMNDGGSAFQYNMQHNVLFEGKSNVANGNFAVEFIVPKDIAYHYDFGKMSFYAFNSNFQELSDMHKITVGGVASNIKADLVGPNIKLYMNDSTFTFGDATSSSPLLIALLNDSSGINITSDNIGHNIVAILDGKTENTIHLNPYFQNNINSYQEGKAQYKLNDLSEGRHSIEVKAFDNYNNSSRGYTEFIVAGNAMIALQHVLNYPNPFTTSTSFYFEHNQPGKSIDVTIQIFTVSGKLVKTIRDTPFSSGTRVGPINWDGLDDYGDSIGKGVYIYQIKVKGEDGSNAQHFEKLVLLK